MSWNHYEYREFDLNILVIIISWREIRINAKSISKCSCIKVKMKLIIFKKPDSPKTRQVAFADDRTRKLDANAVYHRKFWFTGKFPKFPPFRILFACPRVILRCWYSNTRNTGTDLSFSWRLIFIFVFMSTSESNHFQTCCCKLKLCDNLDFSTEWLFKRASIPETRCHISIFLFFFL